MKVFIDSVIDPKKLFDTNDVDPIGSGGEADIFKIPSSCLLNSSAEEPLVKIYDRTAINDDKLTARQNKGMSLVNKYSLFREDLDENKSLNTSLFAFPQKNAMNYEDKTYAGFSMQDLGRWSMLEDFMFQDGKITNVSNDYVMSDDEAVELFYNMTYCVFSLHKQGIVLGDLNNRNILYDTDRKLPLFVDIDSAQVDDFVCDASSEEFLDPLIMRKRLDGSEDKNEGAYEYSTGSDIFALAVNIYQVMVGFHPAFFYGNNKPRDTTRKKMFLLKLRYDKKFLQQSGIELLNNDEHEKRLVEIQKKYPVLYQHFVDVFVNDQRNYFTETLPISDYRNPDFGDFKNDDVNFNYEEVVLSQSTSKIKSKKIGGFNVNAWLEPLKLRLNYADSMHDTDAFKSFVKSLGYDYSAILSGVF